MIAIPDAIFEAICRLLSTRRGRDQAITLAAIAVAVQASRRDVETTIEHNLYRFPFVLVAGAEGYYIPTDVDDLNRYLRNLHSRHRKMQIREATVRRKARAAGWREDSGRFVRPVESIQQELF